MSGSSQSVMVDGTVQQTYTVPDPSPCDQGTPLTGSVKKITRMLMNS